MTDTPQTDQTDPNQKTTPLMAVHEAGGAVFTDFGGWQMPLRYGSELAEHRAVRTSAGIFDLSHMGEVRVSGPEAAQALDHALTANISVLKPGRAKYALVCTESGSILDDLIVYRLDSSEAGESGEDGAAGGTVEQPEYLVVPNAGNTPAVATALSERAAGFDAEVQDESALTALIALQGPDAARILSAVLPQDEARELPGLKYYAWRSATLAAGGAEVAVLLARTGYTGEDGFEIFIGPIESPEQLSAQAGSVWTALLEAGEQVEAELLPCGLASRDSLRLEAGMPLYGNELDLDHIPFESGVSFAVPKNKEADYVGKAALAEQSRENPEQVLVGLASSGRRAARSGYPVLDAGGNQIGIVTSGAPSPTLGHPIAMARITAEQATVGTEVSVDLRGRAEPFTVVEMPFYRRDR